MNDGNSKQLASYFNLSELSEKRCVNRACIVCKVDGADFLVLYLNDYSMYHPAIFLRIFYLKKTNVSDTPSLRLSGNYIYKQR